MKSITLTLIALCMMAAAASADRPECAICGMWIDQYMSTRHVVKLEDRTEHQFCSIACAYKYITAHEGQVRDVLVADYDSLELTDASSAAYVRGSDAPPVMSAVSWVAFSSQKRAKDFIKRHGGKLKGYRDAMKSFREL